MRISWAHCARRARSQPERHLAADGVGLVGGNQPLERRVGRRVVVQSNGRYRAVCDPTATLVRRRRERLEHRDAFRRANAFDPHNRSAAGIQRAIFREHANPIDRRAAMRKSTSMRFEPSSLTTLCGGGAVGGAAVPLGAGSSLHAAQQLGPSDTTMPPLTHTVLLLLKQHMSPSVGTTGTM
jgi:hypothetical protein